MTPKTIEIQFWELFFRGSSLRGIWILNSGKNKRGYVLNKFNGRVLYVRHMAADADGQILSA